MSLVHSWYGLFDNYSFILFRWRKSINLSSFVDQLFQIEKRVIITLLCDKVTMLTDPLFLWTVSIANVWLCLESSLERPWNLREDCWSTGWFIVSCQVVNHLMQLRILHDLFGVETLRLKNTVETWYLILMQCLESWDKTEVFFF